MCFKAHREWDEEVWNKSQTSVIDLETPEAVVSQLAYLITNGIEAGMVETPEEFPGAITLPEQIGRWTLSLPRPENAHFVSDETWPAVATLRIEVPPMLETALGGGSARRAIREAVDERAREIRAERAAKGLGYLGAEAVCSAPITTMGTKREEPGRRSKPTFAVGPGQREAYRRKVRELRAWRAAYAKCLEAWKTGKRDIVWPPHTWKMRVLHNVPCASSA